MFAKIHVQFLVETCKMLSIQFVKPIYLIIYQAACYNVSIV